MTPHPAERRRTILLVRPDPMLRTVIQLHLGASGGALDIVEAANEEAALAVLHLRPVHLAVYTADRWLEDPEWLRKLRGDADPQLRRLPVLLVAAGPMELPEDGRTEVLVAPITGPRLDAAIRRLLSLP